MWDRDRFEDVTLYVGSDFCTIGEIQLCFKWVLVLGGGGELIFTGATEGAVTQATDSKSWRRKKEYILHTHTLVLGDVSIRQWKHLQYAHTAWQDTHEVHVCNSHVVISHQRCGTE